MSDEILIRGLTGRVITVAAAAVTLAVGWLNIAQLGLEGGLDYVPTLALIMYLAWFVFWAPAVIVSPAGVTLINPARTVRLDWPHIVRVDTKWALELHTESGRYTAWAAPAPGRHAATTQATADLGHLPESSYIGRTVRPGDSPASDSGHAAIAVRRQWERLRDSGHLESGLVEHARPRIAYNRGKLAALAALIVLVLAAAASFD